MRRVAAGVVPVAEEDSWQSGVQLLPQRHQSWLSSGVLAAVALTMRVLEQLGQFHIQLDKRGSNGNHKRPQLDCQSVGTSRKLDVRV